MLAALRVLAVLAGAAWFALAGFFVHVFVRDPHQRSGVARRDIAYAIVYLASRVSLGIALIGVAIPSHPLALGAALVALGGEILMWVLARMSGGEDRSDD